MTSKLPFLPPPFSAAVSIISLDDIVLPAAIPDGRTQHIFPAHDMARFLAVELRTPRLDRLHDSLWLAGLPLPARSLQRQALMGRVVHLTERPDEHLVWHQTKLLLKPLPAYLLCRAFWADHLCADAGIHRSAAGLLLSYAWLVVHYSDWAMATRLGLLPAGVSWPAWTALMGDFLAQVPPDALDVDVRDAFVDRRYRYGELRLSRLNTLTRFLPSLWSRQHLVRGYLSTSTWYQAFFETNFSWLLAAFAFFSMLLSALQVGLATQQLAASQPFINMSYGLTVLSLVTLLFVVTLLCLVWAFLFLYHLLSTRGLNKGIVKAQTERIMGL